MEKSISFPSDHTKEICGVKAFNNYLASGGSDKNVFIYDIRKNSRHLARYQHSGSVKALDWSDSKGLISGGGMGDGKIKFWKDGQGIVKKIDTGSQVCGIVTSINSSEILSCHGFSLNQIIIWNMDGKRELTVHGH